MNKGFFILSVAFYILVIYLISYNLLPSQGGLNYTDSSFSFNQEVEDENKLSTWDTMFAGHDMTFIMYSKVSSFLIRSFFSVFTTDLNIISYLIVFGKFLLLLLTANFVLQKIFNDRTLSLFLPLFLVFNNFTLEAFYYGSNNFIIFGYLSTLLIIYHTYLIYKEGLSSNRIILLAFSSLICFHPFMFVVSNILIALFFAYYLLKNPSQKMLVFRYYLLYLLISILLGLFWVLPFLYNSLSTTNAVTQGVDNNNAVFDAYTQISTMTNNFSFISFFGGVGEKLYFTIWQYTFYFLLIIIITVPAIWFKRRMDNYQLFIYFSLLCFLGLALGPNSQIFGKAFIYIWDNFPAASFFRSFKRFFIPVPVFYMILLAGMFFSLKRFKYSALFVFTAILLTVHYPLLSGNLLGSVRTFNIPSEYKELNKELTADPELYNVLDLPYNSYEWYTWTVTSNASLPSPDVNWINYYLAKPDLTLRVATYLVNYSGHLQTIQQNIIQNKTIKKETEVLNVKYVLIHKDLANIERNPISYQQYDNYFIKRGYPVVYQNTYLTLYENPNHVSDSKIFIKPDAKEYNLDFTYETPSKYSVRLRNTGKATTTSLIFKENYSKNWKVYKVDGQTNIKGSLFGDIKYIFMEDVFEETHMTYENFGNEWIIDVPASRHSNFVIFFKTQAYFALGLLISLVTLGGCLISLIYNRLKK